MIGAKKLFNEMNRDFTGPKLYSESIFDYLNRSARLESKRIRNLLEQWIEGLSSEVQDELRARIRSRDDRQHLGAFYELYLHELLSKSGFSVEIHPAVNNKTTHPDFRVLKDDKPLFYLEATLVALSDKDTSAKAREKQVYDAINRMKSPNFFIRVKVRGAPTTNPPGAKMRSFLEDKLSNLDLNMVTKQLEQGDSEALPSWNWKHNGWQITFSPIPKKPEARGKHGVRPIGLQIQDVRWLTSHIKIRESIQDKATKYGELDLPYIVAINVTDEYGVDEIDINNALFGEEQITIILCGNNIIDQKPNRKPNGAWYGSGGPQNQRVSAALIADNLSPWSIAKVTPILWHNPWANRPLTSDTWLLPQLFPEENNQLVKRKGKHGRELLGLDPNWPRTY
jgi:hypothetical protein